MRDDEELERRQDLYWEYMKPLGLERGERRSRATHVRIEEFYKAIDAPVRLDVDHDEIPDPPKVILTEEARRKYKDKIIRAVLKGLEESHKTMRDQAMLARHERGQREEAERKAEERVQAAERAAQERIAEVERKAEERFQNLLRSAQQLVNDNRELRRENHDLLTERNDLHESVQKLRLDKQGLELEAKQYRERLSDIPMPELMQRMGYKGERQGEAHVYRDTRGQVAIRIEQQKAFDFHRQQTFRNSLDLVVHMHRHHKGVEGFTEAQAIEFLREEFGDRRAAGAVIAHREQSVLEFFDRTRQERERALVPERGDDPWRGPQGGAEDRDRTRRDDRPDSRGGGRGGFGGR
jgi:hypothetical protein